MKVIVSQIRPDAGLAVVLPMAVSGLASRLRTERAARSFPKVSGPQFAALARHAAMRPGKLAGRETMQPPSTTGVIAVLVERGLTARAPRPAGKRRVALTAAAAGRSLAGQVHMLTQAWLARRLRELRAQGRSALRTAAPVLDKLNQS